MNYQKIYNNLVQKRQSIPANKIYNYTENHHIIPKSIDKSKEKDPTNIVNLSAKEHFIAHLLLIKIYQKENNLNNLSKMILAINLMIIRNSKRKEWSNVNFTSKLYEKLRILAAKTISITNTQWNKLHKEYKLGKNNGSYNTMWITNIITNENKKIKKDELIPIGWKKGRYVSTEFREKCRLAYKPVKNMWIRKKINPNIN